MQQWLGHDTRRRRLLTALSLYLLTTLVFFLFAAKDRIVGHTPYNHFALLAHGWLEGHLDLGSEPPPYAGHNDFARFDGKWFVTFPPFPALLISPLVMLAEDVELVRDGQFFLWLAGIGPAALFLALEKLRRAALSERAYATNILLACLFTFGTVYFFTAVQGTVWYAAHVVAVGVTALFLLYAIEAERPILCGLLIGAAFMTRAPLLLAGLLFVLEAVRTCRGAASLPASEATVPDGEARLERWRAEFQRLDKGRLLRLLALFSLPIMALLAVSLWHNYARFGDPFEPGYRYLTVAWKARMNKWGLFDYHYLARNLGVVLTSLPWLETKGAAFKINVHGLALWFTTPLYLWLLWPRRTGAFHLSLWTVVALVALPTLFYQNTGWTQFGYRFSNDYAVFLFALLAVGARRFGAVFWTCGLWAVIINGFGAATFERDAFKKYYFQDGSQKVIYQPD